MSATIARTVIAVAAAVGIMAAPSQAATWEAPVTLSDTVAGTEGLQLVAGSDGRVLAVWGYRLGSGVFGVEAASRRPDGRWGPRRAFGTLLPRSGARSQASGVGDNLSGIAAFGTNRWLGLSVEQHGNAGALAWWKGTTIGAVHRGGTLPEEPWTAGQVAAFPDGAAVITWTTMRPRRGAGSNLRPRVVVAARGSQAGFGNPRRISPLPPGPPYGGGLGPALSATQVTSAAGSRRTVVVAWQRTGRVEARISRDRGRTYGPVRDLGPSPEAFPRIAVHVSAGGKVLVLWGAREAQGATRVMVYRAAIAAPGHGFTRRVLEQSAPLDLSAPQALDQFGPATLAGFDGETPIAAWQTVVDGRAAVRAARLEGDPMTATFTVAEGADAVLDDLAVAPSGTAAVAWSTVGRLGDLGSGFVARAGAGRGFGDVQQLPGAAGAIGMRLAYDPQGLLVAWHLRTRLTSTVLAAQLR
jgi:YD repeat-containing protein